jgi:hypothetical protein
MRLLAGLARKGTTGAGVRPFPFVFAGLFPFTLLLAGTQAGAEESRFRQRRGAEAWQPQPAPCACRAMGRQWGMGEEICLDTGEGQRMHVCGMRQNVTNWQSTGRRCPES